MQDVLVARQAIFDRDLKLHAYEVLFRRAGTDQAGVVDGDQATSQVLLNMYTELGLERIVGPSRAFVNMTRAFLTGELPLPFPSDRVVLEVLETERVDAALVEAVSGLKAQGYRIALDDFEYHPSWEPLLRIADLVKLDVRAQGLDGLAETVRLLRPFGLPLLAEKVETQDELAACRDLGFQFFQGYFFSRPNVVSGRSLPPSRLGLLRLLAQVQAPDVQIDALQKVISQDVSLSYKLLRYINSALFALPRKVESIRQAVVLLGVRNVKNWASLLAMSSVDDKPPELLVTALVRGRMCEALGRRLGEREPERLFAVGLFSSLDALLDVPMETVVKNLPLAEETSAALLRREGRAGRLLEAVMCYERGDWRGAWPDGLAQADLVGAWLESTAWADEARAEMGL